MERAEKIGLGVAAVGHIALFALLSIHIEEEKYDPVSMDVMIADEVGLESSSPNPSMLPPATSVAPELGTPEDSDFVDFEQLPDPPPDPISKPRPSVKPVTTSSEPRRRPDRPKSTTTTPKPKPKPKGSRLGADFLKGVTDNPSTSRNQNISAQKASPAAVASLQRELYRLVKLKWRPPTGADAELLRTKVTARLDRNGRIIGTPTATTTGITASNRSQVGIHKERAIAAVRLAAPYTTFPEKFYDEWKVIEPVLYLGV